MPDLRVRFPVQFALLLALFATGCTTRPEKDRSVSEEMELIRETERERLRSLVDVDLATARRLHNDGFQLINPAGVPLSTSDYLSQLESGQLDYQAWEPGEISVRLYGDAAAIRYRDVRFEVDVQGRPVHRGPMYHTNVYERHDGQWQVVWSQASGQLATPPD